MTSPHDSQSQASSSPADNTPEPHGHAGQPVPPAEPSAPDVSRRSFLTSGISLGALTAGAIALPGVSGRAQQAVGAAGGAKLGTPIGTPSSTTRKQAALQYRQTCAIDNFNRPSAPHPDNGDEARYPDRIGSYSKGLPHNEFGEVDPAAYTALMRACAEGDWGFFEAVPSGEPLLPLRKKQSNPLSCVAFDLEGMDSHDFGLRPAPAFASAEQAGEIVEDYWMALLRDVHFEDYATNALVQAACADLSRMSDFRGPKDNGLVTPATLFREPFPGCLTGPYLSQFFLKSQPFGAQVIGPRMRTVQPGIDFMTTAADWLLIQNGTAPTRPPVFDNTVQRYMRNGRDLSRWLQVDVLYQAYFQAALHLMVPADPRDPFTGGGMGCPTNPGNPYRQSRVQDGFTTFGPAHLMTLLCEVTTRALKACWFQKWRVHRRIRPEAFAGRIHHKVVNNRPYPIHSDVLNSAALSEVFSRNGTFFLPQAYPEGSPLHPSYNAGHAVVAGACVTILKALFDERAPIASPVVASADGLSLVPYTGAALTVGGELNKLAMNVACGRNICGVHYRTDGTEGLRLGEDVTISILRDQRGSYLEPFRGFTFTKFDGTSVTV